MLRHLSQVRGLKPSALRCGGRRDIRRRASDAGIVETSFAGSRSMLEDFLFLQTYSHLHRIFLAKPAAILIIAIFYCFFFSTQNDY